MATPGTQYTVFNPNIYVAPVGTVLPGLNLNKGDAWPTGWFKLQHTEEGAVITPSAPKDDITSDEAGGSIGVVPAGGSEITIGFTPITPDLNLFRYLSSMAIRQNAAAVAATTTSPAFPAFERLALNPNGQQFMVGLEGDFSAGSLSEFGGFVRAFGYKVEQTDEVEINMRKTGEDAVMRLGAEVRCLVTEVTDAQKANTGITQTDSRFDMFVVKKTA